MYFRGVDSGLVVSMFYLEERSIRTMLNDLNDTIATSPCSWHGQSRLAVRPKPRFRHNRQQVCKVVASACLVEGSAE